MLQNGPQAAAFDGFLQKLEELRWKIDLLPESQRLHLHQLASAAEQQYRSSPDASAGIRDTAGDLQLIAKYVDAGAKAARRRERAKRRTRG